MVAGTRFLRNTPATCGAIPIPAARPLTDGAVS
jgi:hypothetical protein